jgi:hypothetical protein
LLVLAGQRHDTSNMFCSNDTQLVVCTFLVGCWRLLLGAPLAGPTGTEGAEVAAGMVHSRWDAPKNRQDNAVEPVQIVLVPF